MQSSPVALLGLLKEKLAIKGVQRLVLFPVHVVALGVFPPLDKRGCREANCRGSTQTFDKRHPGDIFTI